MNKVRTMGLGWIMMVIVGGLAGYGASRITNTERGLAANVIVGIVGAVLFNFVLGRVLGVHFGGLIGQFITAVIGASLLIAILRAIRKG